MVIGDVDFATDVMDDGAGRIGVFCWRTGSVASEGCTGSDLIWTVGDEVAVDDNKPDAVKWRFFVDSATPITSEFAVACALP